MSDEITKSQKLSLLTLNLHTYQEFSTPGKTESELNEEDVRQRVEKHSPLFDEIARAINELKIDIICLQEVGEWRGYSDSQFGKHPSNAAQQILSRLSDKNYQVAMDWSHYGWDVWKEGSAIISRYPIIKSDSKYISNPKNGTKNFWQSRNVVNAKVILPNRKEIDIYSVHSGWWDSSDEPFFEQVKRLDDWMEKKKNKSNSELLCGDFNQPAGKEGYKLMTNVLHFDDLYLTANPNGMNDFTISGKTDGWENAKNSTRIDYLFFRQSADYEIVESHRLFMGKDFTKVSDHFGVFAEVLIF